MNPMQPLSIQSTDAEIVEYVRRGDPRAIELLFLKHRQNCVGVAFRVVRNEADAEEVAHGAILHALEKIDECHEAGKFASWLRRIVVNRSLGFLRYERYRRHLSLDGCALPVSEATPETLYARVQANTIVHTEIRRLPPLLREPLLLKVLGGRTSAQAARQLGITEPALRSRLMRARRELQGRMQRFTSKRAGTRENV